MIFAILTYILDDHTDYLKAIKYYLQENGINDVRIVNDYNKLIDIVNPLDGNIFVIDHNLGNNKTGLDAVRELKKSCSFGKFIIVSGTEDIKVVIEYANEGIDAFISKGHPGSEIDIVNRVKKAKEELLTVVTRIIKLQQSRNDVSGDR